MPGLTRWQDIAPADALDINLNTRPDITAPLNEMGERCPWPWEPQQLVGAPLGQFHCAYCGAMCVAGMEHLDYDPKAHPLVGRPVVVTAADGHTHVGVLVAATYDDEYADIIADATGIPARITPVFDIRPVLQRALWALRRCACPTDPDAEHNPGEPLATCPLHGWTPEVLALHHRYHPTDGTHTDHGGVPVAYSLDRCYPVFGRHVTPHNRCDQPA